MKKSFLLGIWLGCMFNTTVSASTVLLDTTTISFSASGTPNSIAGSWGSDALVVPTGATIDYFTVEITELVSDFGTPSSIAIEGGITPSVARIAFCSNPISCVAGVNVGDGATINISSPQSGSPWEFMNRLVQGNSPQINSGNTGVVYNSGGVSASIAGEVLVNVYGEAAVIPIPASVWLFGSGLLGLIGMARRKS